MTIIFYLCMAVLGVTMLHNLVLGRYNHHTGKAKYLSDEYVWGGVIVGAILIGLWMGEEFVWALLFALLTAGGCIRSLFLQYSGPKETHDDQAL